MGRADGRRFREGDPDLAYGDAPGATAARGQALTKATADQVAKAIAAIKADKTAPRLQKEFFERSARPVR